MSFITARRGLVIGATAAAVLLLADTQQPRPVPVGRYQILNGTFKFSSTDQKNKIVIDEDTHLVRIDTSTGETSILMFGPQNAQIESFWMPLGRGQNLKP